jgi:hypothetical protein
MEGLAGSIGRNYQPLCTNLIFNVLAALLLISYSIVIKNIIPMNELVCIFRSLFQLLPSPSHPLGCHQASAHVHRLSAALVYFTLLLPVISFFTLRSLVQTEKANSKTQFCFGELFFKRQFAHELEQSKQKGKMACSIIVVCNALIKERIVSCSSLGGNHSCLPTVFSFHHYGFVPTLKAKKTACKQETLCIQRSKLRQRRESVEWRKMHERKLS